MNRPIASRTHTSNKKPILQLRTESDFVILKGPPQDANTGELAGSLVLMNSDSLKQIQKITITLEGIRKVSWYSNAINPQLIKQKEKIFKRELTLDVTEGGSNKPHQLPVGNHQWPFRFEIPGDTPESIEGMDASYIVYNLYATINRTVLAKDIRTSKHIRIIRTPGFDELEGGLYPNPMEGIWANKFRYKITMPKSNHAYGTSVTTNFDLTPLRKGVTIDSVKMELFENVSLKMTDPLRTHEQRDWCVHRVTQDLPEGTEYYIPEVDPDDPMDEGHRFSVTLDLPKSFRKCRQSCDTEAIRVRHWIQVYVNVKNPEGHTSQINKDMKISLQISPRFAIGDDQVVNTVTDPAAVGEAHDDTSLLAPPTYEDRQFDQLYSDIDPSGFMTPPPIASGTTTPYGIFQSGGPDSRHTPRTHSRTPSVEDLAGIGFSSDPNQGGISAGQLRSSLANLQARGHIHSQSEVNGNLSARQSQTQTPNVLDQSEGYFSNQVPPRDYDLDNLSRVPSYGTAMRSNNRTPAMTPLTEGLPTYEAAISRSASPTPSRELTPRSSGSGASSSSDSGSISTTNDETARNTVRNTFGRRRFEGRRRHSSSPPNRTMRAQHVS